MNVFGASADGIQPFMGSHVSQNSLIAIVDDDDTVRHAIETFVSSAGYATAAFASAGEYLRSGRVADTACVICDVFMLGLTGLDLQRLLIADGHRMPIIFVSGSLDDGIRKRALADGAIRFLNKPLDSSDLLDCLRTAMQRA